ncbi:hypothetical protein JCM8547_006338 [Rhodosporidiobolus lusitaniae]
MLWPAHKWTCGHQKDPFSFPPFTAADLEVLKRVKNRRYFDSRASYRATSLVYWMRAQEVFKGDWPELLDILSGTSSLSLEPWKRAAIFALSYVHIFFHEHHDCITDPPHSLKRFIDLSIPISSFLERFTGSDKAAGFLLLRPITRQWLVLFTIRDKNCPGWLELTILAQERLKQLILKANFNADLRDTLLYACRLTVANIPKNELENEGWDT